MPIVRLIFVTVKPDQVNDAIGLWKNHCAPLMIQQPGCLSEELLECTDAPGEFISYSEWESQASIDKYRKSDAHAEIQKHARSLHGGQASVKRKLLEFLELTKANELILHSDFYRLEDRLRSYEIMASLFLKQTTSRTAVTEKATT